MFRLLVKTTKRLIETRGLSAAGVFAAHFLRALPASAAWAAYVEKISLRRFGGAVPLDLITTGIVPAKGQSSKRLQALRAHYDVLDSYFSDAVLARLLFGRPLAMSFFSGDSGAIYGLDLIGAPSSLRPEGELMIVLRGEHQSQPIALLPLCFAAAGHRGISLHLGHMRLSPEADEAARDLYAMPVKAAIMDAVYALVSVFGVTELTRRPAITPSGGIAAARPWAVSSTCRSKACSGGRRRGGRPWAKTGCRSRCCAPSSCRSVRRPCHRGCASTKRRGMTVSGNRRPSPLTKVDYLACAVARARPLRCMAWATVSACKAAWPMTQGSRMANRATAI